MFFTKTFCLLDRVWPIDKLVRREMSISYWSEGDFARRSSPVRLIRFDFTVREYFLKRGKCNCRNFSSSSHRANGKRHRDGSKGIFVCALWLKCNYWGCSGAISSVEILLWDFVRDISLLCIDRALFSPETLSYTLYVSRFNCKIRKSMTN